MNTTKEEQPQRAEKRKAHPLTATTGEEVLTLKEAAAFLRVSEWGMKYLASTKKVPGRKVGNLWRFLRSELIGYLKRG